MGLSGPKKRTKLSSDPNNTAWSKSTDTFGHKILSAQGWKPGQLLGAENAAHAEHFTAANASHIKVMLREDNLGLGAKLGRDSAETFGLSTLSNIFGRLNGKSDEILEKQQNAQRDAELRQYQTRKFGFMTFVSGGLLVGGKMEDDSDLLAKLSAARKESQARESTNESRVLASTSDKKRKREEVVASAQTTSDSEESAASPSSDDKSRKKRKKKHETGADATTIKKSKKKSKHDTHEPTDTLSEKSKRSKTKASGAVAAANIADSAADEIAVSTTDKKLEKAARRAAKQARKEDRARRREERKKDKSPRSTSPDAAHDISSSTTVAAAPSTGSAFAGSRQAVRQRWIQQKRLASMDAQALNEILMLKTTTVT